MTTAAPPAPYLFFDLHVLRTARLGPSMLRVTFGGACLNGTCLDGALVSGGRDQRIKLFLPHPHQDAPHLPSRSPDTWWADWRNADPAERAVMRTYTVRAQRHGELDIDFVMHGDGPGGAPTGAAAAWAAAARPGDRLTVLGPTRPDNGGCEFAPPAGADWVLIAGDESALPAVAAILESLPAATPARVWIEVPHAADRQDLPSAPGREITWLVRDDGGDLLHAVRSADLPDGAPYAWIAGEAGTVRGLRRHLVNERGIDRASVTFMGYWRRGSAEEDLLKEVLAGRSPHTEE